ncbi:MAG TPA: hypothetical protein H9824_03400 [Candidatus Bacteroides pullicola]|uniref:Uncharacterized protein n=1 Tax=Candidatus Bacteroides pullicola TaxID=2838475 RepID=A0A9D1ZHA6_9BACE|nr:hypothetical protein [Candidatus Bacteroides pullicola]
MIDKTKIISEFMSKAAQSKNCCFDGGTLLKNICDIKRINVWKVEEVSDEKYDFLLHGCAEFYYAFENDIVNAETEDFNAEVKIGEEGDSVEIYRINIRKRGY